MIGTRPTVAFLHLPRTGGTSLKRMIMERVPRGQFILVASPGNLPSAETLLAANPLVVMGHMPYGLHTIMPVRYVTMMRSPVDRLISAYRHTLTKARPPGEVWDLSFRAFATKLQNWNSQSQFLAGAVKLSASDRSRAVLEIAKEHLDTCALVGFLDRIQDFAEGLGLGRNVPRTNRREESLYEPSDADLALARSVCELDEELYAWARDRFAGVKANPDRIMGDAAAIPGAAGPGGMDAAGKPLTAPA